jgi:beta-N-acetylhexosaminidase
MCRGFHFAGLAVAEESRSLGIAWTFFPIADVQISPKNPINTRSFGEDPTEVSAMVSAYIKGSHAGGMLTTLKDFRDTVTRYRYRFASD